VAESNAHEQKTPKARVTAEEKTEILKASVNKTPPKEIFLVHGHDEAAMFAVAHWVDELTGVKPIILSHQINRGQTLIEKFESYSEDAACAIVLMTPDDEARAKRTPTNAIEERARQNVVFELGYFYGKLKRENIMVLNFGVELPGDINGLVYIGKDDWKVDLARELAGLGYPVHF
jgi:predicted nucleotide-binding protein